MSGGSRSDSSGGIGGGGDGDCAIVEQTVINSPVADVVRDLKVGAQLRVEARKQSAHKILVAVTKDDKVAGSLTPRRLAELLACIEQGNAYVAIVNSRSGGKCGVEIRPSAT